MSYEEPEKLGRVNVPALDEILGIAHPVLDDGFVRVVDYMGDDAAVVQAARVSYGVGAKKVRGDRGLIRHLLRKRHTSPFEQCDLKLHVRVPMDAWRQWIRHRTACLSGDTVLHFDLPGDSVAIDSMKKTAPGEWRIQSTKNRQGSEGNVDVDVGVELSEMEFDFHRTARDLYEARLQAGVAREQARKDLPLSTYTEAYWKIDLHNLLHFTSLRYHKDAQQEIAEYATVIAGIIKKWVPITWEAFEDFRLNALTLSALEVEVIRQLVGGVLVANVKHPRMTTGELKDVMENLRALGFDTGGL